MKNIKFLFTALVIFASSCEEVEDQFPSEVKVVSAPTITLIGDPVVILNVGDPYTDEGATYFDSLYLDSGGPIYSSTEVNTAEEGFFVITYTATNRYGFEGSGTRLVAVTSVSDQFDVSGTYFHATRGGYSEVTKVGKGVFQTDNISGGTSLIEPAFFMFTGDSAMIMPPQALPISGPADFTAEQYDYTLPGSYSYKISNPGYGSAARLFVKQ